MVTLNQLVNILPQHPERHEQLAQAVLQHRILRMSIDSYANSQAHESIDAIEASDACYANQFAQAYISQAIRGFLQDPQNAHSLISRDVDLILGIYNANQEWRNERLGQAPQQARQRAGVSISLLQNFKKLKYPLLAATTLYSGMQMHKIFGEFFQGYRQNVDDLTTGDVGYALLFAVSAGLVFKRVKKLLQ